MSEDEKKLFEAVDNGNFTEVENLITKGVNINFYNKFESETPLMGAAKRGCLDIIKLLIKADADVNYRHKWDLSPLMLAAEKNHIDCVKELIRASADVNDMNKGGITALMQAVENGNNEIVQVLLQAGADINTSSCINYFTPLIIAVRKGYKETVQILLDAGADIDLRPGGNRVKTATAREWALWLGHSEVVDLIYEHQKFMESKEK